MENNNLSWINESMEICNGTNHSVVGNVNVFFANSSVDFPADFHTHDDFELMAVKRQTLENVRCDDASISIPIGCGVVFNPLQKHGMYKPTTVKQFICIAFPKEFGEAVAKNVFYKPNFRFSNTPFLLSADTNFLLGKLFDECNNKNGLLSVKQNLLELIFIELIRSADACAAQSGHNKQYGMSRAVKYLDEHVNRPFSLDELAKAAGLSKYHFCRLFKQEVGLTPTAYLTNRKIETAKQLLTQTNKTNTEIAAELSFSSPSHFSKLFKEATGLSPTDFKQTIVK